MQATMEIPRLPGLGATAEDIERDEWQRWNFGSRVQQEFDGDLDAVYQAHPGLRENPDAEAAELVIGYSRYGWREWPALHWPVVSCGGAGLFGLLVYVAVKGGLL